LALEVANGPARSISARASGWSGTRKAWLSPARCRGKDQRQAARPECRRQRAGTLVGEETALDRLLQRCGEQSDALLRRSTLGHEDRLQRLVSRLRGSRCRRPYRSERRPGHRQTGSWRRLQLRRAWQAGGRSQARDAHHALDAGQVGERRDGAAQLEARDERADRLHLAGADLEERHPAASQPGGKLAEQAAQQIELQTRIPTFDAVITTAAIPGRPAPKLITAEAVRAMRPGSVIVDLAAESGGNCELTEPGSEIVESGVTIVGLTNLPSTMATHASTVALAQRRVTRRIVRARR